MNPTDKTVKILRDIVNIEKAFELVYQNYMMPLSVDEVAKLCGYSKCNFCKIFKKITDDTFHNFLNRYRIKTACEMLLCTNFTIERISSETGFSETKTFCRVFKKFMGITAGEYINNPESIKEMGIG